MKKTYTSIALSEALDIYDQRWRRWSRFFLGIDNEAGRGKGKARTYTFDEAFYVWLCGYLLERMKIPVANAKDLGKDLQKWFKANGFFDKKKKSDVKFWEIQIKQGKVVKTGEVVFSCKAKVTLEAEVVGKIKPSVPITVEKYFIDRITKEPQQTVMYDTSNVRILYPIAIILEFNHKMAKAA